MSKDYYSFPVILGEHSFKNYLKFDVMQRQRRFKTPVRLTVILYIIATLCFAYQESFDFAYPLGCILIVIAVFIPTNFFRSFANTSKEQIEKMNLTEPREVYTIHLSNKADGITYYYPDKKQPAGTFYWKNIFGVWRTKNAIYLYVNEQQALLIPDNNKNVDFEGIWKFIQKHVKEEKIHEGNGFLSFIK